MDLAKGWHIKGLFWGMLVLWSSTGCYALDREETPSIVVTSALPTRHLLYATETSVQTFFSRVLNQRPRKVRGVGNWQILQQDEAFFYYGYPVLRDLFTEERVIHTLYKVSRYQVEQAFPTFQAWMSPHPPERLQYFQRHLAEPIQELWLVDYGFDPERPDLFAMEANVTFKGDPVPCRYRLELNLPDFALQTLQVLPIQQQIAAGCQGRMLN